MRLKDKVAIVTGAGSGIGKATSLLFAQEGAKVVVADCAEMDGRATADEIVKEGGESLFVRTDVSEEGDTHAMAGRAVQEFGKLNILVNNAATFWFGTVLTATPEDYDRLFGVNVKGYGLCAKAAIPYLQQSGNGVIVNVSSMNAVIGMPGQSLYNATKAAIIELTKSMAIDFPELRINVILPGMTNTASLNEAVQELGFEREQAHGLLGERTLVGRLAEPLEIAQGILFLASDEASYATGCSLLLDGGVAGVGNPAGGVVDGPLAQLRREAAAPGRPSPDEAS